MGECEPPSGEHLPADVHAIGGTGALPEPHLPPAVSPNVASVVPPIPDGNSSSSIAADNAVNHAPLFVDHEHFVVGEEEEQHPSNHSKEGEEQQSSTRDADHVVHDHVTVLDDAANNNNSNIPHDAHVEEITPQEGNGDALPLPPAGTPAEDNTAASLDNTGAIESAQQLPQQLDQPHDNPVYSHPEQQQQLEHVEPEHPTVFSDPSHSDLQPVVVSMTAAMPTVSQEMMPVVSSQEMNRIPVSLSGASVDASVPMVTVASESVGIHSVNVSAAMSNDIYTTTGTPAQLTNPATFSGMEYITNPSDQPETPAPAGAEAVQNNFAVEVAPKFQDEVVNVVAALPGTEGVHAPTPVPIVTSVQAPIVMPASAVNAIPQVPFGGETVDKCVECEVCGSLFGDAGSLRRHAARAHRAASGKGPVFCPQCSAALKNEQNLRRHIAVCHSGSQENRCNMCSASFGSRGSLRIHQQSVHSVPAATKGRQNNTKGGIVKPKTEKSFLCDMCTDTFKWKGNLKRHRKLRHLQERPFQCKICHATFGTKSNMGVHYITHQNNNGSNNNNNNSKNIFNATSVVVQQNNNNNSSSNTSVVVPVPAVIVPVTQHTPTNAVQVQVPE